MISLHDAVLETWFWAFVDGGLDPGATPLFAGVYQGQPLAEIVAADQAVPLSEAEAAIESARREVEL